MNSPESLPQSPPQIRKIEESDLCTVSEELWGSPVYGAASVGIINLIAHDRAHAQLYRRRGGFEVRMRDAKAVRVEQPEHALQVLRETHPDLPYALKLSLLGENSGQPYHRDLQYAVAPSGLSAARIGEFLRHRQLVDHSFHGTVGKALDVLGVVSECTRPQDLGASHVHMPFLSAKGLAKAVDALPFRATDRRMVIPKIGAALREQLQRGRPGKYGEVIVEGELIVDAPYTRLDYAKIARQSLAVVPDSCSPTSRIATYMRKKFAPDIEL